MGSLTEKRRGFWFLQTTVIWAWGGDQRCAAPCGSEKTALYSAHMAQSGNWTQQSVCPARTRPLLLLCVGRELHVTSCRHTGGIWDSSAEHMHSTLPCQTPVGNNKQALDQHLNGSHCELTTANADPDTIAWGGKLPKSEACNATTQEGFPESICICSGGGGGGAVHSTNQHKEIPSYYVKGRRVNNLSSHLTS